jgi:TolB-like protein/Tfp pilus assembly protein PilF
LSVERENAFFAGGVQDQVLTDLSKIADLKVISRTSVGAFRSERPRDLREIGRQLGVAHVLQGSVQRVGNRVRVSAQLVAARSGAQLWAESYDRELADVFAIQSEIARAIATQLQAKLSPQEEAEMQERPTRDLAAYDLYLQGKELVTTYLDAQDTGACLRQALRLLEEATARDPNFILAYCYAARAHNLLYSLDLDPSPNRILQAENAIDTALRLRPRSAEAHLAKADHYFRCRRDFAQAEKELALAGPTLPNSIAFYILQASLDRRRGRWQEARQNFAKAVALGPRNSQAVNMLTDTDVLTRNYGGAIRAYERAIASGLGSPILKLRIAIIEFAANADVPAYRAALEKVPADLDVGGGETPQRILVTLAERDYAGAWAALAAAKRADFQDVDFSFYYPRAWYEALIARAEGDMEKTRTAFAAAREILEERLRLEPDDARTLAVIAQIDAGLGRKEIAFEEAKRAAEMIPISRDAYDGPLILQGLAQVHTWTGEKQLALDLVEQLLRIPGYLSYGHLLHDPVWDPLRADPRFERLVASLAPTRV